MLKSYLLIAIAGVTILIAGGSYLFSRDRVQIPTNQSNSIVLASVWDRETETYMESGNRKQPFDILAFGQNGQVEVFASYENY